MILTSRPRLWRGVVLSVVLCLSWITGATAQTNNLDQIRNGPRNAPLNPPDWVNGNANKTQAHLAEGYSQAYRLVISGLTLGAHSITIEWDTKSGGKHGIDFITHYQRMLPHTPIFDHAAETIQPLLGLAGSFGPPSTFPIPTPSGSNNGHDVAAFFNSLPPSERMMTIFNGTITSMTYLLQESLTQAAAKTQLKINFNATDTTVVLAWGGHIARSVDWGIGFSAASIGGASYHMRLADGNQQDKQLSADAVVAMNCADQPACTTGEVCGIAFCDPDTLQCTVGVADAGTVCSAGGVCTDDAVCDGIHTYCPANTFKPATTICRSSQGACDLAEYCTGDSATCPADSFATQGTVCGGQILEGSCSGLAVCSGISASCPSATVRPAGTLCRAANGACDIADFCDGVHTTCPDNVKTALTVCGTASDVCANNPVCNGVSKACQPETFKTAETVCRSADGVCDIAETCTGHSAACPANQFASHNTICRGEAGTCDIAETCTGSSALCPTDSFLSRGSVCRAAAGVCDAAETCTGSSAICPVDIKLAAGTTCRSATGVCDAAETCDGINNSCPDDGVMIAGTICRSEAGVCDVAERCDGISKSCPADGFVLASANKLCRPSVAACDLPEYCNGLGIACPADSFVAAGTQCRDGDGVCNPAEMCTGTSGFCPGDITFVPNPDSCNLAGLGVCRTAGFWGTHGGTEKNKSINITQAVIDFHLNGMAAGPLNVCGEQINNTIVNNAASALEALCVSVQGDQRLQLARQLTAAALNCSVSGYQNCEGYPKYEGLFAECNRLCAETDTAQQTITYCISAIDCLNNGGTYYHAGTVLPDGRTISAAGYCKTGTCSNEPNTPCNTGDTSLCGSSTATCTPDRETCHDQPLCLHIDGKPIDGAPCFSETGPAGSTNACNNAHKNNCTVIGAGETYCRNDSCDSVDYLGKCVAIKN